MLEEELGCHRITVAKEWLQDKIEAGVVHSYSDGDILNRGGNPVLFHVPDFFEDKLRYIRKGLL